MPAQAIPLVEREAIAQQAAHIASTIIEAGLGRLDSIHTKSSSADLVTNVDIAADEAIREFLAKACPDDALITEESFQESQTKGLTSALKSAWIVDPIDGTTNFAHTFPTFCVSIAYVADGECQVGVILDPTRQELFSAVKGQGATLNGVPISVSDCKTLDQSLLATGFPYIRDPEHPVFVQQLEILKTFLIKAQGVRRLGSAALDLAYVANGRLDGFWEYHLAPWDVAAGLLIVQEAGGTVTGLLNEPLRLDKRYVSIAAATPAVHQAMVNAVDMPALKDVEDSVRGLC